MPNPDFINAAVEAGFSRAQARFLDDMLAKHPHSHEIEDVDELPQILEELGVSTEEDNEEEEEGEEEELK